MKNQETDMEKSLKKMFAKSAETLLSGPFYYNSDILKTFLGWVD